MRGLKFRWDFYSSVGMRSFGILFLQHWSHRNLKYIAFVLRSLRLIENLLILIIVSLITQFFKLKLWNDFFELNVLFDIFFNLIRVSKLLIVILTYQISKVFVYRLRLVVFFILKILYMNSILLHFDLI